METHSNPLDTFREETRELLADLEQGLIQLEEDPTDLEQVHRVFRSLHTIKGSGNMFELTNLVSLAHSVESAFALLRDGKIMLEQKLIDVALRARDVIEGFLSEGDDDPDMASAAKQIEAIVAEILPADAVATVERHEAPPDESAGTTTTYRIQYDPAADSFRTGANPLLILRELEELGETLVVGNPHAVPHLDGIDPEACYVRFDILLTTDRGLDAVKDVFIFVEGEAGITIDVVDDSVLEDTDLNYKRLGEILVERGDITSAELQAAVSEREFLGEVLVRAGYVTSEQVESALAEQEYVRTLRQSRRTQDASASIKVKTEKLDSLVNLVGEFVSMHANLSTMAGTRQDEDLEVLAEHMENLVREMRDLSIEMHMVPIELLFMGFRRLVRDLSGELGKEVRLEMSGTETELDKNVIDALKDPLLHIIRNSIDHGIEPADVRTSAGKPPEGTVHLHAYYAGAGVVIEVRDDGRGMDIEKIREKAVSRGLLNREETHTEQEVLDCIFLPGFSTAESATSVSGRGVGMDVVKRNIEQLGGSVAITTEVGVGTTIRTRIPLTLAMVEGLLAMIGQDYFMINLAYIVECLELQAVRRKNDSRFIDYRGHIVPFVDLREYFGYGDTQEPNPQLIIVALEGEQIGLVVDRLQDNYQSVIKTLGKVYERAQGISGAVILGDGTPALLLDVDRLVRVSRAEVNR
jgi:two-component system chemotaxis sensor kinase CheA